MAYNFDQIINRKDTASLKWDKYKNTDIIPMWVADMDFKAPQPILDILEQKIKHGIFGYTLVPDKLDTLIIERMKTLYNWEIHKDWIVWVPGVVSALNIACKTFGQPHEKIVTTTPIYPPFLSAPANAGKALITVPMIYQNQRACLDFDGLEKAFKQDTSLFMFCNPYNPCGTVFTKKELQTLVDLCDANNVILCSDEIHSDFVLDENKRHIPTPCVSKKASKMAFTIMAPSKTYNIPGLGCSFAIIPDESLRQSFKSSLSGLIPNVNALGLFAAQAAYEKCDKWLGQLILYLKQNSDLVYNRVNQMKGCRIAPIESTYLAWIDIRDTRIKDPIKFFEDAGVGLSDGKFFGQTGFVRLNFGCPRSVLETALKRMEDAL